MQLNFFLSIVLVFGLWVNPVHSADPGLITEADGPVMVVAHRACWSEGAPENSLAAISSCIERGVEMVEIDVGLTADGVPVLMHDTTLDRTTNGTGLLAETSLEDLKRLSLRVGSGGELAALTDQIAPTLGEALALTRGRILVNLDIKGPAFDEAFKVVGELGLEKEVVMKMAAGPEDQALTSAKFLGRTHFMPLVRECTPRNLERQSFCVEDLNAAASMYDMFEPVAFEVTFSSKDYFEQGVHALRGSGRRVWVNTLSPNHAAGIVDEQAVQDPVSTWGYLVGLGVNMIQTDAPFELQAFLTTIETN